MKTVHRLSETTWTSESARTWCSVDISQAAHAVADGLIGFGAMLPLTLFSGARVFPVVEWWQQSLALRLARDARPLLDPALVRDMLDDRTWAQDYPTALSIVGFIGIAPLSEARQELAALRSMGRTVAMTPCCSAAPTLTLAEFDLQGTAVVSLEDELHVLVEGDAGARHGAAMSPVWMRFYEEQLFDWALKTESLPSPTW